MKNFTIFIFYLFIITSLEAQEFTYFNQVWGGDTSNMVSGTGLSLPDGNFLIFGHYQSITHSRSIYFREINKYGKTNIFKSISSGAGIGYIFHGRQIVQLGDNDYILALAPTKENGYAKTKLLKLNKNKEIAWEQEYDYFFAQTARHTIPAISRGFICAGARSIELDSVNQIYDTAFYVLKTDENGKKEWDKSYNFGIESIAYTIQTTPDDAYIIAGYSFREDRSYDMQVAKIDTLGNLLWSKRYGSLEGEGGAQVVPLTTKEEYEKGKPIEYLLVGEWEEDNRDKFYIAKLDNRGEVIWERKHDPFFGNPFQSLLWSLQTFPIVKEDKGFIGATFYERRVNGDKTIVPLVADFDGEGNINWIKEVKPDTLDFGQGDVQMYIRDMQPTLDGGYILTGFQHIPQPQKSWVAKIDSLGNTCFPANCDSTIILTDIPEFEENNIRFSIAPNPVREQAKIHYQFPRHQEGVLTIYNLQGVLVEQLKLSGLKESEILEVENWARGVYLYSIEVEGRRVGGGKLVVE